MPSRVVYRPAPPLTVASFKRWAPSMAVWSIGLGTAAIYFLSVTPKVKNTILLKVPVLNSYYEDKTPPEDKPF